MAAKTSSSIASSVTMSARSMLHENEAHEGVAIPDTLAGGSDSTTALNAVRIDDGRR